MAQKSLCHTVPLEGLAAADTIPLGAPFGYWPHSYHSEPRRAVWPLCISVGQRIRACLVGSHISFYYSSSLKKPHTYLFASYSVSNNHSCSRSVLSLAIILPSRKLRKQQRILFSTGDHMILAMFLIKEKVRVLKCVSSWKDLHL